MAVIAADGLSKSFGSRRAVDALRFEVSSGEVFGFLGPNGAGKTTTIRMLMGLYRPTAGAATVLGLDPIRHGAAVRRQIGYLPGELALYPRLTGGQHVSYVARARGLTGLGFAGQLADRFGAVLDRPVRSLSKGNRQKIGILLAVMARPEVLILDEPTSGLDPLGRDQFERLIRELAAEGRTVFLSSHELDQVQRVADRVAIIRDGRLAVTDTVAGLRASAPRLIEFRFAGPADPGWFAGVDGASVTGTGPRHLTLTVRGPVAPVLRAAARLDPVDIVARPPDLDELFLAYYRNDAVQEPADAL
jgi:ABC-2 type transport system ATP-binding protein